jgi:hypothetical protein
MTKDKKTFRETIRKIESNTAYGKVRAMSFYGESFHGARVEGAPAQPTIIDRISAYPLTY